MNQYFEYRKLQGRRGKSDKYLFKPLLKYLESAESNWSLSMEEAREFQREISGRKKEDGTPAYSSSTIHSMLSAAGSFYRYLVKKGLVFSNPFDYLTPLRRERPLPRHLMREDRLSEFLDTLADLSQDRTLKEKLYRYKTHLIAELLYSTGARISEIVSLRMENIDLDRGMVRLTDAKTQQIRTGFLNEYVLGVLRVYLRDMRVFFCTRHDGTGRLFSTSPKQLAEWFNQRIKKYSGENLKSHNFRHMVGYHLLRAGCGIRHIQAILGHRSLNSTSVYTRIDKEDLRKVLDETHPRRFGGGCDETG